MSESIGAALRRARERRQLTLAQVAETTRIRPHYLQALENDDISAMPSAAQARGFLKLYAEFLGLDLQKLVPPAASEPAPESSAPSQASSSATRAAEVKRALPNLWVQLRERIGARREDKSGAETSPVDASMAPTNNATPAPAEAPTDSIDTTDKKKANRPS